MYKIIQPNITSDKLPIDEIRSVLNALGYDIEFVPNKPLSIPDKLIKIQYDLNCTLLEALDVLKYIDEQKEKGND